MSHYGDGVCEQNPFNYLVPSLIDSNLRLGGGLNLDPTQTNQLAGRDGQEKSDVSLATIILHSTYMEAEGKVIYPFTGISKAGTGISHLHGQGILVCCRRWKPMSKL